MEDDTPRLPPQMALVVQHPDTPTIDPTPVLRVTWQDQVQVPPAPPQRVEIELLSDDPTPPLQRVPDLLPVDTPQSSSTFGPQRQPPPLPPPPWTAYDVAAVSGTAITVPTTSATFTTPSTANRATILATRISELEDELRQSRQFYNIN
jgi:hypothetical protein